MHIIGAIVFLIILAVFWNYLFYIIGGISGIVGLFILWCAKDANDENKLSDEQWHAKYPDKNVRESAPSFGFALIAMILLGICGLSLNYQTESWNNSELIAQEEAEKQKKLQEEEQAKIEKEQAKIEKEQAELEEKIQNKIAMANSLSGEEKKFYDAKFQEYLNAGDNENSSRSKALTDVDNMIQQKQKAEQERIAAEKKAQRLAQEEQEKIARWGNKVDVANYLEYAQPFAVANFIKNQAGIIGPLAGGDIEPLRSHAWFMSALAESIVREKKTKVGDEVSNQVAIYFECDAELAAAYITTKNKKSGSIEKAAAVANIPILLNKQLDARKKIQEIANWCGADLKEFGESLLIQQLKKKMK